MPPIFWPTLGNSMKIIISPAKKMRTDNDSLEWLSLPHFLPRTKEIYSVLQQMTYDELKKLWKCNDQIAQLNVARLQNMELEKNLTPAILAYEGIQYQYMAPGVFTTQELEYIQNNLYILSGFYGMLRPFDGVTPYRLEMQAKLSVKGKKDLYEFWASSLADRISEETDCIINLASKEYSVCISKHLNSNTKFITCTFCEEKNGKLIEKGTMCKMARGEMVRYMAEQNISLPDEIKQFSRLNYKFSAEHSNDNNFVFIQEKAGA